MRETAMHPRSAVALLLVAGQLTACASIHEAGRTPIGGDRGAVRVAVFADDDARAAGRLLGEPIAGELEQRHRGEWRPVFRTLDASWAVAGLEPGRYRVRFSRRLDATGAPEDLERPVRQTFDVRAGEAVDVELILDHVSPGVVAAGVVAAVVAAVVLHEWLDDHGLPHPPPPPRWALDAAFWISLDLAARPAPVWLPNIPAVQVTSHFPRAGEVVAPERVRVVFVLSEAIEGERLGDDAVAVNDEDGREIPGNIRWDARGWWLVWEPFAPLPPGRRLRAELVAERFHAATGRDLAGATGFEFETER